VITDQGRLYPVGLLSLPKKGMQYYYVYVLMSESDMLFYSGYIKNLDNKISEHESGKSRNYHNRLKQLATIN